MKTTILALVLLAGALPACQTETLYSQSALNALQTREFDHPFDPTYDAAVGALFDLGYTVRSSDKRGGFLSAVRSGEVVQIKLDQQGSNRTSVRVSTGTSGQTHVNKQQIDQILDTIDRRLNVEAGAR